MASITESIPCEKLYDDISDLLYYIIIWAERVKEDGHGLYKYAHKMRDAIRTDDVWGGLKNTRVISHTELAVSMSIFKVENIKRSVKIIDRMIVELDKRAKVARACWGGDGV